MVIDGESLRDARFSIDGQTAVVTLKVKDIIFFRLLEVLNETLRRK